MTALDLAEEPACAGAPITARLVRSGATGGDEDTHAELLAWIDEQARRTSTAVEPVALEDLSGWGFDPSTGNLVHETGRFFTVEGLEVRVAGAAVPVWTQPIIEQPEVGILGLLASEIDGVLHLLVQAKVEPGNVNGVQISPTVQATRSNYTGAHRGRAVPYLDFFLDAERHTVHADVRQSEQGAWFHQKRNRNMVVEADHDDVPLLEGYRWLTLGQLHRLLHDDDVVNMDTRTVLACLPWDEGAPAAGRYTAAEVTSWLTRLRSELDVVARPIPLSMVQAWERVDGRIRHESGLFFDVMGVRVRARGREVDAWTQPMIEAAGAGVVAFLAARLDGVRHLLVHARVEGGYVDVVEMAPTVQCKPDNYRVLPPAARPPFLDVVTEVLAGHAPGRVLFDTVLSEEGGRFYRTRNRYLVVEVDPAGIAEHPDFRWVSLPQLGGLLRHSHYLNVQARSLVACTHSLPAPTPQEQP